MRSVRLRLSAVALLAALLSAAPIAFADPALRIQQDVEGDFVIFGNTLAQDCQQGTPAPVVGTVASCPAGSVNGGGANDFAPDVFWRSDDPADGEATADASFGPADARSTAVLRLPQGARVVYARLYWAALAETMTPDGAVRVQRSIGGLDTEVTADASLVLEDTEQNAGFWYQSTADVTSLVAGEGPGPYRVTGVESIDFVNQNVFTPVAAWYVVVFYELDGEPQRNLALFDGLDLVTDTVAASASLSGFLVPDSGFDARLGVVALEGEAQAVGDSLAFNGATLSNAVNPADNFFNASRSELGAALTVEGDLPQLSGEPRSYTNVDFDVVDVTSLVSAGDTSATIEASSTLDRFLLSAFVTSISTFKPEFIQSTKVVEDLDGGGIVQGDELRYTIEARNSGSDVAINTVVSDPLPAGVTYVPGSITVVSGPNAGDKTDAAGDDQAEYDEGARTVTVRIGDGADDTVGGELAIGESVTLSFRVTVDDDAGGTISNQAIITAEGEQGAPAEDTPTDGNAEMPGQPPTDIQIDECDGDADCEDPTPFCDVTASPRICVACLTSAQCTDPALPDCDFDTGECVCADGSEVCDDADGDGLSDGAEEILGTDPNYADSDDDGVPDGAELAPEEDRDGDGLIGALDPDSDNDGLFDGTELGLGCDDPATDLSRRACRPDGDMGDTITNPLDPDSDNGGLRDGSEDFDLDGVVDAGETDPTAGNGDDDSGPLDSDRDRLSDALEELLGSDPNDADSDDDGVPDGDEPNPSADSDLDGLLNVLDVDSDDDGLFDGTELGRGCDGEGTDADVGHCRADNDGGATVTSPLLADTDGGGVIDGAEDVNLNGVVDGDETNPVAGNGDDDGGVADADGDGLSDGLEAFIGTDPEDADSDDDGVPDGREPNPADDQDGDGLINALDPDADDDGLFDGTELGFGCDDAATDAAAGTCVADGDGGATTTSSLARDTDFGGVPDGEEDANRNGVIDDGETDPNDAADDVVGQSCSEDADCGAADSGLVCDGDVCGFGCRGEGGNGCPAGEECSSSTMEVGQCGPPGADAGMPDAGMADAGVDGMPDSTPTPTPQGFLGGGGCDCRAAGGQGDETTPLLVVMALLYVGRRRRRRF